LEWPQADQDKALWWFIHEQQACGSCGTRPDEWDEDAGGDPDAYIMEPYLCKGCRVKADGEEWYEKNRKNIPRGTQMRMRRPDPVEAD
jgi:hypothetical protein